jgi:hypothetical protein
MEQHFRRRYPERRTEEDEDTVIRSVWSLYLEDIQDIHDVLNEIALPVNIDELAAQVNKGHEDYARSMLLKYKDDPRAPELLGLENARFPKEPRALSFVKIQADDRPDLTIDALDKLPRDYARDMTVTIFRPLMWVSCSSNSYRIHVPRSDDTTREAKRKIAHVLQARSSKALAPLDHANTLVASSLLLVVLGLALRSAYPNMLAIQVLFWVGVLGFAGVLALMGAYNIRKPVVVLRNEKDAPGFWQQNRGSAFVGSLIGFVLFVLAEVGRRWL